MAELLNFQNSFNCHRLEFLRTAPLPIHKVNNDHILRWYGWGSLVFCKQTSVKMAAIGTLRYIAVENIVRKGEIAYNKQFLLFSHCFLSYMALIFHCKCILKCCLQFVPIWTSLKFCRLVMG